MHNYTITALKEFTSHKNSQDSDKVNDRVADKKTVPIIICFIFVCSTKQCINGGNLSLILLQCNCLSVNILFAYAVLLHSTCKKLAPLTKS